MWKCSFTPAHVILQVYCLVHIIFIVLQYYRYWCDSVFYDSRRLTTGKYFQASVRMYAQLGK